MISEVQERRFPRRRIKLSSLIEISETLFMAGAGKKEDNTLARRPVISSHMNKFDCPRKFTYGVCMRTNRSDNGIVPGISHGDSGGPWMEPILGRG